MGMRVENVVKYGVWDRPGGMHVAIESAALAAWQALACQIQSTSLADISDPPQISPQRPCAFRPADPNHASDWFRDFQKTIASAEPAETKLGTTHHDANMHQKCKLQAASFMLVMLL